MATTQWESKEQALIAEARLLPRDEVISVQRITVKTEKPSNEILVIKWRGKQWVHNVGPNLPSTNDQYITSFFANLGADV